MMIKKHKFLVIITSIVILLPIAFGFIMWDRLPESMAIHWGVDGFADDHAKAITAILLSPLVLLVVQWLCIWASSAEFKRNEQDPKLIRLVLWIIPFISILTNAIMYATAFGYDIEVFSYMFLFFGIITILIGNYMPKARRNKTVGIKIKWTLANDDNWIATHRFTGKLYVIIGFVISLCVFIPFSAYSIIIPFLVYLCGLTILPVIYSYSFYKKQLREGTATKEDYEKELNRQYSKGAKIISIILIAVVLLGTAVLMFTGEIKTELGEKELILRATYNSSYTVEYSDIKNVELSNDIDLGVRLFGFQSARLEVGSFKCDKYGTYKRYTYTSCDSYIVLTTDQTVVVINAKTEKDTVDLYNEILKRTEGLNENN